MDHAGTADGGTVVKVLRYKSVGRWFDSRWCHCNFCQNWRLMDHAGTAVAQWSRYCATNRKVAGSIPDGVIGIFVKIGG
jgi:hypothetical protein